MILTKANKVSIRNLSRQLRLVIEEFQESYISDPHVIPHILIELAVHHEPHDLEDVHKTSRLLKATLQNEVYKKMLEDMVQYEE